MTGREKKKLKVSAARTIAVQPSTVSSNTVAGPSNFKPKDSKLLFSRTRGRLINCSLIGLSGLPATLDVEKFVEVVPFLLLFFD